MPGCQYEDINSNRLSMSEPPLVIHGMERFVAVLDDHILIGNFGIPLKNAGAQHELDKLGIVSKIERTLFDYYEISQSGDEQLKTADVL